MAATDDWSADSNEALLISLDTPTTKGPKPYKSFNPSFTFPLFGDAQQIFGYKNLAINLRFRANDMRPFVKVSYAKKFDAIGDTEPADIDSILKEFLPAVAFSPEADYVEGAKRLSPEWKPPGELLTTISDGGETYEVWKGTMADPAVKQMVNRIQVLSVLFIDGGSLIVDDLDTSPNPADSRWTIFFLFRKDKSADDPSRSDYTFVGYSTVFRFFYLNKDAARASPPKELEQLPKGDFDLSDLPCRSRISQFVILPPFQRAGNGARLYTAVFDYYTHHAPTRAITVEDPNEEFDDLRDVCDLAYLRSLPAFNNLQIKKDYKLPSKGILKTDFLDLAAIRDLCATTKIAERQFMRCVEMHLMSKLPKSAWSLIMDKSALPNPRPTKEERNVYELWRVWVKMRLYVHNRDALGQLDHEDRVQKLNETVDSVESGYARILAILERRPKEAAPVEPGKRKRDETEGGEPTASKKARVEEEEDDGTTV
ncbi:related to histone acetyltransferase subunit HAT1 [Cephalotrichum gorgonifer]|uniref:Histone acetyltransferase type B catalytic subunit n=1 Tax=Cephalotrichum gorgonifer TaxID=2041049 RepID=A0AAE8MW26_9PEZI|nr:related to histone acetyltransferase subunit HAT1 [Cephalotrichum gorgonifer]